MVQTTALCSHPLRESSTNALHWKVDVHIMAMMHHWYEYLRCTWQVDSHKYPMPHSAKDHHKTHYIHPCKGYLLYVHIIILIMMYIRRITYSVRTHGKRMTDFLHNFTPLFKFWWILTSSVGAVMSLAWE